MRGDSFNFKMLLTIFSLQKQSFNKFIVDFEKNGEIFISQLSFFQKRHSSNNQKLRIE